MEDRLAQNFLSKNMMGGPFWNVLSMIKGFVGPFDIHTQGFLA